MVCLLNPDSVLLDGNLVEAARYLDAHRDVGVMGGRIVNEDGSLQPSARASHHTSTRSSTGIR